MSTQALRGLIRPLVLVDVLAYLGRARDGGVLKVKNGPLEKSIMIRSGTIVFARSNREEDRLGDILLAKGAITQDQYDQASALIFEKGFRHGRALVEIGAISPKLLWQTIQDQIQTITCSLIPMEDGSFEFVRKEIRLGKDESVTFKIPVLNLVVDAVRNLHQRDLFRERFDGLDLIYQRTNLRLDQVVPLEAYENYVLEFIDGKTPLDFICQNSEIGEKETLRVVFLLRSLGLVEQVSGYKAKIAKYNRIFIYIHEYLRERVGSVGTSLLARYFADTRQTLPEIFELVECLEDGALDTEQLFSNVENVNSDEREGKLSDALDEYLFSGILVVKKLLGAEHESKVLAHIDGLG